MELNDNLNEKDKLVLQNLINPDTGKDHTYDWPLETQQRMLGCLLSDKGFLDQCFHLVKPYYFSDKAHQKICRILYEHYNNYKKMPDKLIIEMQLADELKDNPARDYYIAELEILCDCVDSGYFQRDFFLTKITEFAKTQAVRVAFAKVIDILTKGKDNKWQLIEETMKEALSVQPNVDLGLNYFEDLEKRYDRMIKRQQSQDYFTSGFGSIDVALGGGLARGEMGAFCAMSGAGKSLCMAGAAADNLSRGRKVLYVSLEMDEDKTSCRFDSMFTMIPHQLLLQDHEEVVRILKEYGSTLPDKNALWVKQFPAGTADVATIRAYMSQLSLQKGFVPDMVIVDYVGEMKDVPGIKTYESRQRLVRDLRGLAVEFKVCVLTGMQVGRAGREAMKNGYIDDSFLADSQGQIRPLDALWSINMEDAESECGVGRIFVVKHRNGKSRFMLYFRRDPKTLKMLEIAPETYRKFMSEHAKKSKENVDIDNISSNFTWKPNKPSGDMDSDEAK